jgi:hypothetical protein
MSVQELRQQNRLIWEELSAAKGDPAKVSAWVDRVYAPSVAFHSSTGDMNFEQVKQFHIAEAAALVPEYTLRQAVVEGDTVVSRFTGAYTHKATFMGLPATGKKFQVEGAMFARLGGGKIDEVWFYLDSVGFMRGLGAIFGAAANSR